MFTHIYDLIIKLFTLFLAIIGLGLFYAILFLLELNETLISLLIISSLIGVIWFYNRYLRTLATYMYCRFNLKMKLNFNQAKTLNEAFTPFFSLPFFTEWLPMIALKKLDIEQEEKYQLAINQLQNWEESRNKKEKEFIKTFKEANLKTRILTLIMLCLLSYFFVTTLYSLAPTSNIINVICGFLDIESYYPSLFIMIFTVIIFGIFVVIDPKILILLDKWMKNG